MPNAPIDTPRVLDLAKLIEQLNIGRFHLQLLAICAAVVFMDGFDAQAIGYVAPSLNQAWHLVPGAAPVRCASRIRALPPVERSARSAHCLYRRQTRTRIP